MPGDKVVTWDGTFKQVQKVLQYEHSGDIRVVKIGDSKIAAVGVHPILTRVKGVVEWVDVDHLTPEHEVAFPVPEAQDMCQFSEDDIRMYALLLAYGKISCEVRLMASGENYAWAISYLEARGIAHHTEEGVLRWSKARFPILSGMLKGKGIFPPFLRLPVSKGKILLEVLRDIDSRKIQADLRYMQLLTPTKDNIHWLPVKSISQNQPYTGPVYDLEIADNHNYLTSAGLAHNGGKRKGAETVFLTLFHIDILEFIDLVKKVGDRYSRAHDINTSLWTHSIFMERVEQDADWSLFCPAKATEIFSCYGEELRHLYTAAESDPSIPKITVKARDVYNRFISVQRQAGMPYIMYADACNFKSNQKNLGYLSGSNLCVAPETMVLTSKGQKNISSLVGRKVQVWNGEEFTETRVFQTSPRSPLVEVKLSDGSSLTCTKAHNFLVGSFDSYVKKPAEELTPGTVLAQGTFPILAESVRSDIDYVNMAIESSDSWYCLDYVVIQFSYLVGANYLRLLLQTMGTPSILKELPGKSVWYLTFPYRQLMHYGLVLPRRTDKTSFHSTLTVISIEDHGRQDATYCFTEVKGRGVFNGILTGQCQEIVQYTSKDEIAVCNLSSMNLRKYANRKPDPQGIRVPMGSGSYDFHNLALMTRSDVEGLNRTIDANWYPLDKRHPDGSVRKRGKCSKSNFRHRPIGLGVSGFAEALYKMDMHFEHPQAKLLNRMIFACMYFNAMAESVQQAILHGKYSSFSGSPLSKGKFQFDLWREEFELLGPNVFRTEEPEPVDPSMWKQSTVKLYNNQGEIDRIQPIWKDLRRCVLKYGAANSLLIAPMPTASTAQLLKNTESVEAPTSNLYSRKVLKGSYPVLNTNMMHDLESLGLWNLEMLEYIQANDGSLTDITEYAQAKYPQLQADWTRLKYLEQKYKTTWDLSQKIFINMAADRGRYVCQSQSTNVYLKDPDNDILKALHLTTWKLGLKTGIYYLRQKPVKEAIKFTVDVDIENYISEEAKKKLLKIETVEEQVRSCTRENKGCIECSG